MQPVSNNFPYFIDINCINIYSESHRMLLVSELNSEVAITTKAGQYCAQFNTSKINTI